MLMGEPRCKVCNLRDLDEAFYIELFKEKRSLREYQKMAKQKYDETKNEVYILSYSSFRRHILAGERHYD
jgi:hypothetical protein